MRVETDIVNIGDPFVLYEDGVYYMYATHSNNGINVWKGVAPDKLSYVGLCYYAKDSFGYECFWAPEVVKRYDGKYVMHFSARDRRDGLLRTGVAIADSPIGGFRDVKPGQPMFDIGTATIDASCFIDGDEAYLFYVKDCSVNMVNGIHTSQIFAARLNRELTQLVGDSVLIATPSQKWESHSLGAPTEQLLTDLRFSDGKERYLWNEGPSVIKHGGKYYMTYSSNCFDSRRYSVGYAVASAPLGPYKKYEGNPIMEYIEGEISGPGHNSFFTDAQGKLFTAFHIHTHYDKPSGDRRYCYCPVEFDGETLKLLYKEQ